MTEMTALQEQLASRSAALLQFSANYVEWTDELSCLELQSLAEDTVVDNLRSVAGTCERSAKRAQLTRRCKNSFAASSTAAFSALLAEQDDFENCREALMLKS